jgi:hypothetical protein
MTDLQIEIHKKTITLLNMIRRTEPALVAQQIAGVQPMNLDSGAFFTPYIPKGMTSKYKFSRARWYAAVYNYNYYHEVFEWCTQHFGPHPGQPDARSRWSHKYEDQIQFRDEQDYMWFVLKWGK